MQDRIETRQTARQTGRQTTRQSASKTETWQTAIQKARQTEIQRARQTARHPGRQTARQTKGKWQDRRKIDSKTDRKTDTRQTARQKEKRLCLIGLMVYNLLIIEILFVMYNFTMFIESSATFKHWVTILTWKLHVNVFTLNVSFNVCFPFSSMTTCIALPHFRTIWILKIGHFWENQSIYI